MLRKKRVGLIVWGTIFLVVSFALFLTRDAVAFSIALFVLAGAILMLVFGVINVASATRYNNILLAENLTFRGNCPYCNRDIQCTIRDFRLHGRYPEGFLYCPVCRKPISKNAFQAYRPEQLSSYENTQVPPANS